MPTYTNTSYAVRNVSTGGSTLTTVAGGATIAVTSLVVSNTSSSPITCDVYFTRSAANYYLIKTATIPVGGALEVIAGNRVVLIASDALVVAASAANSADATASVLLTT